MVNCLQTKQGKIIRVKFKWQTFFNSFYETGNWLFRYIISCLQIVDSTTFFLLLNGYGANFNWAVNVNLTIYHF